MVRIPKEKEPLAGIGQREGTPRKNNPSYEHFRNWLMRYVPDEEKDTPHDRMWAAFLAGARYVHNQF